VLTTPDGWIFVAGDRTASHGTLSTWAVRSPDGGATWEPALLPPLASYNIVDLAWVDDTLLALAQWSVEGPGDIAVLRSSDAGASWSFVSELPRPDHTAVVTDVLWHDGWHATVRLTWLDPDEGGETRDRGLSWAAGEPRECGPNGSVEPLPRPDDTRWKTAPMLNYADVFPVVATSSGRTLELRVAAVDAAGVYGYVRSGAELIEASSGARLRTRRVVQARLDADRSGRLRATVGAGGGVVDCTADGSTPPLLVSAFIEPADLLPVVARVARFEQGDGTSLRLAAGALVERATDGGLRYRFEAGPPGVEPPELPLPAGVATISDRFEVEGPLRPEAPSDDAIESRVVSAWGAASLLGVELDLTRTDDDGIRVLGSWGFAAVDGSLAKTVVGCARATLRVGEGFDATGSYGLGAYGRRVGLGAAELLEPGTRLTDTSGAVVATVSEQLPGPGAPEPMLGSPSSPVEPADGRRCAALAGSWFELADGSPWLLCTR
jgi:hypothetical protein